MQNLFWIIGLSFLLQAQLRAAEDNSHLRGIHFLYMQIDESFDDEVTAMERLDLSDIMELQLRRGKIDIRQFIANRPELCIPVVELSIDTSRRLKTGQFDLVLKVRDKVMVNRNQRQAVATTFELRRSGRADSNEVATIKAELRELMAQFVTIFREQNPLPQRKRDPRN